MQQQTGRVVSDAGSQVLTEITHGGHVLTEDSEEAAALAGTQESVVAAESAAATGTPFDYLFDGLAADFPNHHLPGADAAAAAATVAALEALGSAMVEDPPPTAEPLEPLANSSIPPVYTYWGQFVDHDLTANTDRDSAISDITRPDLAPLAPGFVTANLFNLRQPALNLDSLYGDGPAGSPERSTTASASRSATVAETSDDPARPIGGDHIPPGRPTPAATSRGPPTRTATDRRRRNDENLIVAQLHIGVPALPQRGRRLGARPRPGLRHRRRVFDRAHAARAVALPVARRPRLPARPSRPPGVADQVLLGGNRCSRRATARSTCRWSSPSRRTASGTAWSAAVYDYNRNFGRPGKVTGSAPFNLLFTFTGKAEPAVRAATRSALPFNWVIEWDRFVDKGAVLPDRFARRIDTRLAPPLRDMLNRGQRPGAGPTVKALLKRLAAAATCCAATCWRIPTGQAVARGARHHAADAGRAAQGNTRGVNDALDRGRVPGGTPLWYYVLKEAEVRANGNSLGPVGSRIVAETHHRPAPAGPRSFLNHIGGWTPAAGVTLPSEDLIVTFADFLRFAGVMV